MYEKLDGLILAHIQSGVLIDCQGIVRLEVGDRDLHGLFVEQGGGGLSGIDDSVDAWRQDVVDGIGPRILLDVDGRGGERAVARYGIAAVGQ